MDEGPWLSPRKAAHPLCRLWLGSGQLGPCLQTGLLLPRWDLASEPITSLSSFEAIFPSFVRSLCF